MEYNNPNNPSVRQEFVYMIFIECKRYKNEFFYLVGIKWIFKARANRSVIEYVNEIRISHAKSLLEKESLAIGEIACRVGFNDINYFSRRFKAVTGMTPSEYKRKCIENK